MIESFKPKLGVVLVSEFLGTALLVTTFNLLGQDNVLTNAVMYFLCVLITFQTSCAQLNPAITFALWLKEYSQKSFVTTLLIITSQIIGAFLGLELAMLMRVVYGIDGL